MDSLSQDQSGGVEEDLSPPIGVMQNQYQTLPRAVRKTRRPKKQNYNETYKKKLTLTISSPHASNEASM